MNQRINKTVAFIVSRVPSLDTGGEVRNFYLSKGLGKHFSTKIIIPNYKMVTFLDKNGEVKTFFKILFSLFLKIPYIEKLRRGVISKNDLTFIKDADIIQLESLEAFYPFEKYIKDVKGLIVLDTHNIDYIRFKSEIKSKGIFEKFIGNILADKLKKIEINVIKRCDYILVCSNDEKLYFSKYIDANKIIVVPNGAEIENKVERKELSNNIFFMGLLSYQPNIEGIQYYLKEIHPKVVKEIPGAKLTIVGKNCPEWLKDEGIKNNSIEIKGFVKDVKPYISQSVVCICPVLSGSGTRLKILEYMSLGKPVVSTSAGAEGIKIEDNKNILIADNANTFCKKVVWSMKNKSEANKIGQAGKKLIQKNYSWSAITDKLGNFYKNI